MRFTAPVRGGIPDATFAHPAFADIAPGLLALCRQAHWPDIATLNACWPVADAGIHGRRFIDQDSLDDGRHYEVRIHETGLIATRRDNWHDLFNAMVWLRQPRTKSALNRRQVADIRRAGTRERTRGQCALTHFDEAGAVLRLADAAMLSAWDAHDWPAFFGAWQAASREGLVQLWLFGHALHEHALNPGIALVAKALVIESTEAMTLDAMDARLADAIDAGRCLQDPQELRPIPLSGIPGWHAGQTQADFYRRMPCFRPKRPGRVYPAPLTMP